jgi:lysophospholipase L1-like esterase
MQIKGKKVNFLGDSITEGVGASAPEFMYVNVFERKFEPAIVRNYGIGGTRIALIPAL